jgi:hypothetical protein
MEHYAAEYRKPCFTTLIVNKPRTPPEEPVIEKLCTFNIYWDFILRFYRRCQTARIVYCIYNKGKPLIAPRVVEAKSIKEHDVLEVRAVYLEYTHLLNAHHLI